MSWHTPFDSSAFLTRIQELTARYLSGEQSFDSSADQFARSLAEWFQAIEKDSLQTPPRFTRLQEGSRTLISDLREIRPGLTDREAPQVQRLLDAAVERFRGLVDGAV